MSRHETYRTKEFGFLTEDKAQHSISMLPNTFLTPQDTFVWQRAQPFHLMRVQFITDPDWSHLMLHTLLPASTILLLTDSLRITPNALILLFDCPYSI
jgi:hypothetical protein